MRTSQNFLCFYAGNHADSTKFFRSESGFSTFTSLDFFVPLRNSSYQHKISDSSDLPVSLKNHFLSWPFCVLDGLSFELP